MCQSDSDLKVLNNWDGTLSIETGNFFPVYLIVVLLSIVALLSDPNPGSSANTEAGNLYLKDQAKYSRTVREWVAKYASDA